MSVSSAGTSLESANQSGGIQGAYKLKKTLGKLDCRTNVFERGTMHFLPFPPLSTPPSLETRKLEIAAIKDKYPNKIPVRRSTYRVRSV